MKIPMIYLETSVLNFVFADDSPEKKADTIKLFEEIENGRYIPFTSDYVKMEIENAPDAYKREDMGKIILEYDVKILPKTDEIDRLAEEYVQEGIIPRRYLTDALHIATRP